MDLTKLAGGSWGGDMGSLAGSQGLERESTVETFLKDTAPTKIAQSVGDLLQLTRERQARQFIGHSSSTPNLGADTRLLTGTKSRGVSAQSQRVSGKKLLGGGSSSRKALPGVSYTIQERPPNRTDIENLDRELESRVQAILSRGHDDYANGFAVADLCDPHKDTVTIIRNKLLAEFRADYESLRQEPWLDRLIRCECLKITCDDIAIKLVDMVAVSSTELGHVMRKLRLSYRQSFDQMRHSWQMLRAAYLRGEEELRGNREDLSRAMDELNTKENTLRADMDNEIESITGQFNNERAKDRAALAASEFKMEQMAETLQSLNGIFKTMQTDGTVTRAADMTSKCQRLERENADLSVKCLALDKVKNDLAVAQERIEQLEKEAHSREVELTTLKQQMARREETVVALMEKESLRMAEIEKLKSMAGVQDDEEDFANDFKEPPTSVLCIKCKKGLDDLSNIRAAVLGKGDGKPFACESFRILLPNLRGRRPDRGTAWVRNCMRCIFIAKMREDVSLLSIKGEVSRFPLFAYSWFERAPSDPTKKEVLAAQFQSDEDRWGFYYGIKALVRENDPEAVIFWSLLDEAQGEDGLQFAFHCMSMAMSMGRAELWRQFGPALSTKSANINVKPVDDEAVRVNIWLDLGTATEALKAILVRAMKPHVQEAVDAIYALKVVPSIVDPQVKEEEELAALAASAAAASAASAAEQEVAEEGQGELDGATENIYADDESGALRAPRRSQLQTQSQSQLNTQAQPMSTEANSEGEVAPHQEPTHISFFMWLRLMMQQVQAEQIHRAAAVRLMFESASVGALTPQIASASDPLEPGTSGSQLEYPQFQSICRTLFPSISVIDAASLYALCFDEGRRKVTAEVLLKVADRLGLFSKAMRLSTLPLLANTFSTENFPQTQGAGADEPAPGLTESDIILRTGPVAKADLLRSRLGALIHRKLAAITPDVLLLAKRLPERWRAMLMEARDQCLFALTDAYEKIKRSKLAGSSDDEGPKAKSRHFIDGIQPYVYYRRFLSIVLLVKNLADNPLLPAELFLNVNRNNVLGLPGMDLGLKQAENLLSALEDGVVTALRLDAVTRQDLASGTTNEAALSKFSERLGRFMYGERGVSKVYRFEAARRSLVARRLQEWTRKFLHNEETVVTASLRACMRPGYLRGARGLRKRAVVFEPWWAQSLVAEAYAFKTVFDNKASRLGQPPILLSEATAAALYARWGSLDLAERDLHDLCHTVRTYAPASPRLRLFAALVGQPCDLDAGMAAALATPHAASAALGLIVEIHREIARDADAASDSTLLHIEVLFPSAGNPTTRADKCDLWMADGQLVVAAVSRWATAQRGLDEEASAAYQDLAEFVRGSSPATDGTLDVDDLLWVIMTQWARFAQWFVKRASARAVWNSTNAPQVKAKAFAAQLDGLRSRPDTRGDPTVPVVDFVQRTESERVCKELPAPLQGSYLRSLVESLYPAGEGARTTDAAHYNYRYLQACARHTTRCGYNIELMDKLLRSCALWDTNSNSKTTSGVLNSSVYLVAGIGNGTSGSNALSAASLGLAANKDGMKEILKHFSEMMNVMHSPELERNILAAENALHQISVEMPLTSAAACDQPVVKQSILAAERWADLQNLISAIDDLIISFNVFVAKALSFPQDRPASTRPVTLPRAGCYSFPLKNITG